MATDAFKDTNNSSVSVQLDANGGIPLGGGTETAATDSTTTSSIGAFIKGLVKIFADVWDSVNHLLGVGLTTKIAGEDLTNDVLKVEERFSYFAPIVADAQIKAGAGYLHSITISCNDAAPTAGSVIVYDSLTETGTQILNHTFTTTPFVPTTIFIDASFATGLYIGFTTTADVNVQGSYR